MYTTEHDEGLFGEWGMKLMHGDRVVFSDLGLQPEDATLGRALSPLVNELNRLDAELQEVKDRLSKYESGKVTKREKNKEV